jgi:hypothetical protein
MYQFHLVHSSIHQRQIYLLFFTTLTVKEPILLVVQVSLYLGEGETWKMGKMGKMGKMEKKNPTLPTLLI